MGQANVVGPTSIEASFFSSYCTVMYRAAFVVLAGTLSVSHRKFVDTTASVSGSICIVLWLISLHVSCGEIKQFTTL